MAPREDVDGDGPDDADPFRYVDPLPSPDENSEETSFDVIVSGAGPVGVLLGCHLRLLGANVALVDPHLRPGGSGSKAAVTMPRTLEVLSRTVGPGGPSAVGGTDDAASRLLASGARPVRRARVASDGSWIGDVAGFSSSSFASTSGVLFDSSGGGGGSSSEGCRFPPVTIGQNVVEDVLARRYAELGGKMFSAARVTSLVEDDRGVAVGVTRDVYARPPDAAPEVPPELASRGETTLSAKYAVGADGRNSAVRELLGIPYVGRDYDQVFYIADVEVEEGEAERCGWDAHEGNIITDASGSFVLVVRIQGNTFRTYYCAADMDPSKDCTEEFIRSLWEERIPGGFRCKVRRFEEPTLFRISCRLADRYASPGGRVFLAGDAAHCHSPAGAQGMNTGIQDAANLAWKLGAVLARGEASSSCSAAADGRTLLGTYEAERRPVAEWVLENTDSVFRAATTASSPLLNALRNVFVRIALALAPEGSIPPASARDRAFGLSLSYRDAGSCFDSGERPPRGALFAGDRLPDLQVRRLDDDGEAEEGEQRGYLHDLLGPLSSRLTLLVVSEGRGADVGSKEGAGAVGRAVEACSLAAAKLDSVSNTVLVVLSTATSAAVASPPASTGDIRVRTFAAAGGPADPSDRCFVWPSREGRAAAAATLAGRLRLGPADVAVAAVRPDTYLALIHRGTCDATALAAGIERLCC